MTQPHRLTDTVKILHKIAVVSGEYVLLLRRHAEAHSRPDQWDLPGGNAEWPETTSDQLVKHLHAGDVVRELEEETGIIFDAEQLGQPIFFDTFFEPTKPMYTVAVGWRIVLPNRQDITLSREHSEYVWSPRTEVVDYDFGFAGGPDGFLTQIISLAFQQP